MLCMKVVVVVLVVGCVLSSVLSWCSDDDMLLRCFGLLKNSGMCSVCSVLVCCLVLLCC